MSAISSTPQKKLVNRALYLAAAFTGFLAFLLIVGYFLLGGNSRNLAEKIVAEIESADEPTAAELISELPELGISGIDSLATLMASSNDATALAAAEQIRLELLRWRTVSDTESAANRMQLATSLARHADNYSPKLQAYAADFAVTLLLWNDSLSSSEQAMLTDHCQRILQSSDGASYSWKKAGLPSPEASIASSLNDELPSEITRPPSLPPSEAVVEIRGISEIRFADSDLAALAAPSAVDYNAPPPPRLFQVDSSESAASPRRIDTRTEPELIAELNIAKDTSAIKAELERRGYSPREIRLISWLHDPNPANRANFARALPGYNLPRAEVWLELLKQDSETKVRAAAVQAEAQLRRLQR